MGNPEIRSLHGIRPWRNLPALAFPVTWALAAAVFIRFPVPGIRWIALALIAAAIAAMDIVMHEAAHGILARNRTWNRWLGFLFGACGLVSVTAYRAYHLRHHRQRIPVSAAEGFLNGTPAYLVAVPILAWRTATKRQRRAIAVEYTLILFAVALALLYGALGTGHFGLDLWLYPLGPAVVITSIRGWTETIAVWLVGKGPRVTGATFVRPAYRLICDHLEHHLWPAVPWYNLPSLRAGLREEYRGEAEHVSYLRFLWDKLEAKTTAPPALRQLVATPNAP